MEEASIRIKMKKHKKTLSLIFGGLVLLLILLIAFLAILPKIINLEPVKKEVLARFSEKMGG